MTDIEKKELRGVTLKLVWTIVLSAAGCIGVGVKLYTNVIREIQDNRTDYKLVNQRVDFTDKNVARNSNDIEIIKYKISK